MSLGLIGFIKIASSAEVALVVEDMFPIERKPDGLEIGILDPEASGQIDCVATSKLSKAARKAD